MKVSAAVSGLASARLRARAEQVRQRALRHLDERLSRCETRRAAKAAARAISENRGGDE